jgi:hypothetical protein
MNVYISGTPGVSASTINDTIRFLNKSQGNLTFIKSEGLSEKQLARILKTETQIESFDFHQLDEIADFYRTFKEIDDSDFIVFLSDYKLDYEKYDGEKRWFSYFSNRNIVVKTYGWEGYTLNRSYLAISHQIVENIFQSLSGLVIKTRADFDMYHFDGNSVCINNFALLEEQIKIKLLSGIICETCILKFSSRALENKYFYPEIDDILERVRRELKVKVRVEPVYEDVNVDVDGSIQIGGHKVVFEKKYLHYLYLFFLVNNGNSFTEKNIFQIDDYGNNALISLIKSYNIIYGYGYTPPNLNDIPKLIQKRIKSASDGSSTFNSYRSEICNLVPEQYGISTLSNGNKKFKFSVNIPPEKLHLPNSFLGFRS